MSIRDKLDISAYLVIGPENTLNRPVGDIIKSAIESGFTCIQIRSKVASAKELIKLTEEASNIIEKLGKSDSVTLVVNDRLDVVLAARDLGIKVDGIHIGQRDIPVETCRKYLGEDSIIGLSARSFELIDYIKSANVKDIDYFGAGPLFETKTKPDCGIGPDGNVITRSYEEIEELEKISPIPVVIGGGVKLEHIPRLAQTGIDGFFVVTAVTEAEDPKSAARELVNAWKENERKKI